MFKVKSLMASVVIAAGVAMGWQAAPASAGDENGNFMIRLQGTVVDPQTGSVPITLNGALIPGANASVSETVLPTLTLTYFLNKNLSVELFCCFSKHEVRAKGAIAALGDIGESWIFPPVLTLQYHFDNMGPFKPYVGAGVQFIHFFNEKATGGLAGSNLDIDSAFGFTLQAGVDISLGDGWYLNADVKKTWLNTEATWSAPGAVIRADVDLDPWIFSLGVGYRFNLEDIFGRRHEALK